MHGEECKIISNIKIVVARCPLTYQKEQLIERGLYYEIVTIYECSS